MKLIKINYFIIIFIFLVGGQVNASDPEGIKLNNEAVEFLNEALKLRKEVAKPEGNLVNKMKGGEEDPSGSQTNVKSDAGVFSKLLDLVFNNSARESPEGPKQDERKNEKNISEKNPGSFLPGKSKEDKEKEDKNIGEDIIFDAHKKLLQATLKSGELPEVRMNLGLTFELSGDVENSLKAYSMSEKMADDNLALKFIARYNKARMLAEQKKIPLALAEYQSALEINPESVEVKVNIELLTQKQQGGGGGGGGKDKKDQEGGEGKDPKPDAPIKENPKNSEYKSKNLSKKNVEKILEELKNQEQKIREKEYNKGIKEKSRDKDW